MPMKSDYKSLECRGVGKKFRIGGARKVQNSLTETIMEWLPRMMDNRATREEFWALKNISFDVQPGEIVGIIGRNGAGKSTLLKILSGVTAPTEGEVLVRGRVGSLLEVGTGFNAELTGRENVFLSGAILGMRHAEVVRKFDEIVAFAQMEKFVDTPVKRYSSGMHLRLGFAVAAHLEAEILLVDEVLAVGDAAFQQKCMDKIREITRSGRTVLFVSHSMVAISNLCQRCVVIKGGEIKMIGKTEDAVASYLEDSRGRATMPLLERKDRTGTGKIQFSEVHLEFEDGLRVESAVLGQTVKLIFTLSKKVSETIDELTIGAMVSNNYGQIVTTFWTEYGKKRFTMTGDSLQIICRIPKVQLAPGRYTITIGLSSATMALDWLEDAVEFVVTPGDMFGTGFLVRPEKMGLVVCDQTWFDSEHIPAEERK